VKKFVSSHTLTSKAKDLWWKKWYWNRFFSVLQFPPPIIILMLHIHKSLGACTRGPFEAALNKGLRFTSHLLLTTLKANFM
jgi:hypothetical protein